MNMGLMNMGLMNMAIFPLPSVKKPATRPRSFVAVAVELVAPLSRPPA